LAEVAGAESLARWLDRANLDAGFPNPFRHSDDHFPGCSVIVVSRPEHGRVVLLFGGSLCRDVTCGGVSRVRLGRSGSGPTLLGEDDECRRIGLSLSANRGDDIDRR
jgi:hypothetical protein